jgi:hypothetical protein
MTTKKIFTDVKSFIVDRSKWYRGHGSNKSFLLVNSGEHKGQMCCLGMLCRANGFSPKDIMAVRDPLGVVIKLPENKQWNTRLIQKKKNNVCTTNSNVCEEMMHTNDDHSITDTVREKRLTKLFAEIDVKVKFEG